MLTERFKDLLEAASDALAESRDPFSLNFLGKHRVTATECIGLSNTMSLIIYGYLAAPDWVQKAIFVSGALGSNGDRHMAQEIWPHMQMEEVNKRLKAAGTVKP